MSVKPTIKKTLTFSFFTWCCNFLFCLMIMYNFTFYTCFEADKYTDIQKYVLILGILMFLNSMSIVYTFYDKSLLTKEQSVKYSVHLL